VTKYHQKRSVWDRLSSTDCEAALMAVCGSSAHTTLVN